MENNIRNITIAYGDGIGSEIMEATLFILMEAGAKISVETIEIGERIYNMGAKSGILPSAWDILRRNKILLKSPIIIPIGDNNTYRDINEAIYEKLNLAYEDKVTSNIIENIEGSEWLSASANIGDDFALFETTHDAAPEIAGKNIANPSAMIQAAIMMLTYINQIEIAEKIKAAFLLTLSNGIHTADIYRRKQSKMKASTREFAEAVVERL